VLDREPDIDPTTTRWTTPGRPDTLTREAVGLIGVSRSRAMGQVLRLLDGLHCPLKAVVISGTTE
jgi:hypothetical protein